jgi:hypothetical protein
MGMIAALWASRQRNKVRMLLVAIVAVVGATAYAQIRLNVCNQPFYDAVAHEELSTSLTQLGVFGELAGVLLVLNASMIIERGPRFARGARPHSKAAAAGRINNKWRAPRLKMPDTRKCAPPSDAMAFAGAGGRGRVSRLSATREGRYALGRSLTQMRRQATAATRARIVLGGKPHSFMGFLPGILEGVLLSIDASHALYILGGFGGAARNRPA